MRLFKKSWAAELFMSRSDVLTVLILTVMDLFVVVLLNISSLEKKDFFYFWSSWVIVFSSTFLVSLLLAYLSIMIIVIMNRTIMAISARNKTD